VSRVRSLEHSYSCYATPQLPRSHGKGFCHWLTVRQGGVLNFSSNQVFFSEKDRSLTTNGPRNRRGFGKTDSRLWKWSDREQPFMETVMSNKVRNKLDKFGILMKM
jgi:hypothetical protein